jgi:NAD(P)-dependent dehydrogenase (short-subunit alcohol dehydrogenase family)
MTQRSPVVLVTGASSGIGQAVANAFVARGFEVFGTSRNPRETELTPGVELVQLDVTDPASVTRAISTVIQRAGRIDILVNNAGVGLIGAAEESSDAQVQQLFATNFFGIVRLTREVLPFMRAQGGGRVINIGSVLGLLPAPYGAFYAASKHAVEGYSESLDHETREFGVRVSVVEPGSTNTPFDANLAEPDSPINAYANTRQRARQALADRLQIGDDPFVVAQVVLKAATARKPRVRYPAGALARRMSLIKKVVPAATLDRAIRKAHKLTPTPKRNGASSAGPTSRPLRVVNNSRP